MIVLSDMTAPAKDLRAERSGDWSPFAWGALQNNPVARCRQRSWGSGPTAWVKFLSIVTDGCPGGYRNWFELDRPGNRRNHFLGPPNRQSSVGLLTVLAEDSTAGMSLPLVQKSRATLSF